ncbi:ubiquinone/menaquinone biosynthesis methyltransferase [Candidatus Zixiibacteriota bacterium]
MQQKKLFIRQMYATLADGYDRANHVISLGRDHRWRQRAVAKLPRRGWLVDLGGGTGDMTQAYFDRHPAAGRVVFVDFSREMIRCARRKFAAQPWRDRVHFVLADVEHLPFKPSVFAGGMSAFVLRNLPSVEKVARETARVLQPGRGGVFLDATRPSGGWWRRVYDFYWQRVMPLIAAAVHRAHHSAYRYLAGSVIEFPPADEISQSFRRAGFAECRYCILWGGIATIFNPINPGR